MKGSAAVEGIVMVEKEFGRKVGKVTDSEDSWREAIALVALIGHPGRSHGDRKSPTSDQSSTNRELFSLLVELDEKLK
jgi:hypothetical protein